MASTDARSVDGRRLRRQQNRETVIDALIQLFEAGVYQPSAQEIAEQAGVSPRSLFRYFDDLDDLSQAAILRLVEGARQFTDVEIDPSLPLAERITRLVAARVQLFETTAAASRAARITAHRRPPVATQLRESREFLRMQIATVFAHELRGSRDHLLPAIDALCSFETYELLRTTHRLPQKRAAAAIRNAVSTLLGGEGDV